MEDKQKILDLLLPALQATRDLYDLVSLTYKQEARDFQTVTATFINGATKKINVSLDSGVAMVWDVVGRLR